MKPEPKREDQSIERVNISGKSFFYSVERYDDRYRFGQCLSHSKARSFHELIWTEDCPPVEALTTEFQGSNCDKARICDPALYKAQMLKLLGFD
jgi:hypothetical protein